MRRQTRGFTLVELMVTIALLGVVMAIAVPAMRDFLQTQKMKAATFDLVTSVMYARSEAIKFGGTTNASISIVAPSNDLGSGWCVVFTDASTCNLNTPGADVMRVNMPVRNITYRWFTTAGPITFNRSGRLSSTAPVKIQINDGENRATPRCLTVDASGNATSKTGACS